MSTAAPAEAVGDEGQYSGHRGGKDWLRALACPTSSGDQTRIDLAEQLSTLTATARGHRNNRTTVGREKKGSSRMGRVNSRPCFDVK